MPSLKYPVFVPTKGRASVPLTFRALDQIRVPFRAVVEAQEAEQYAAIVGEDRLLILPFSNQGLVATRNWIWDVAQAEGVHRFWTFDDNIRVFYRLNRNKKFRVLDGAMFCAIEDFVDRYHNIAIAGCNYQWLAKQKQRIPPLEFNTRVYSNMLIRTDMRAKNGQPYRNRGFYNDDTDLCLQVLKDGWVTILFNAFLVDKMRTMTIRGGMTPHYEGDGRYKMAQELVARHPDVARISWKWGRWQHHVDYRPFAKNRLLLKPGLRFDDGVDEFGMRLVRRSV